jgi:hypothetical protein
MWVDRRVVRKGAAILGVKILVVVALLLWAHAQRWQLFPPGFLRQMGPLMLLSLATTCLTLAIAGWQLRALLAPQRFTFSYLETVGVLLVSSLFGLVLSAPGRETVKAVYLCREEPARLLDAVAVLTTDHIVGAIGKVVLGLLLLPLLLASHLLTAPLLRDLVASLLARVFHVPWLLIVPAALLGSVGVCFLAYKYRVRCVTWLSSFLHALGGYRHAPRLLLVCSALALLNQSLTSSYLVFAFMRLQGHTPLTAVSLTGTWLLLAFCRHAADLPFLLIAGGLAFLLVKMPAIPQGPFTKTIPPAMAEMP